MKTLTLLIALIGLLFVCIVYSHALDICPRPEELPECTDPEPIPLCRTTQDQATAVSCFLCHDTLHRRLA